MAMLLKNNVIFVRTPKTGSTFCKEIITKAGLFKTNFGHNHDKWENLNQSVEWQASEFKMCFVRDPLDWYKSYWSHRMNNIWRPDIRTDVNHLDVFCKDNNFERFILKIYDRYPNGYIGELMQRYRTGCDFVGNFNNLRQDLYLGLTKAGLNINIELIKKYPEKNVSNPIYKNIKVSQELIKLINEKDG